MNPLDAMNVGFKKRLPMVLQTEAAECGLASLCMVLRHHGQPTDLAELRRRHGMSLRGATLKDLVRIADALKLAARPLRLELEELAELETPAILHWDLNHFVVLARVGRNAITIHDPAVGIRRLSLEEASKHFTGVALELIPTGSFEPDVAPPRIRLRSLVGHVVGLNRTLGEVFLLALALEVIASLSPLFMQWVVDDALVSADRPLLTTLALGFALLLAVKIALSTMRGWMVIALGASLKVQGRANLFSHLVNLPASYFEARHMGDVMSRFGSQETILQAVTTDLVEAVLDGVLATITLGLMFVFAPGLSALVLGAAVIYALLRWASYSPLREASAESITWAARRDTHFLETLRGIKTVKLFNAQDDRRSRWLNLLVETLNRQIASQRLKLVLRTARSTLMGALGILVVWLGARSVLEHTFSVGMLLAFIAYKDQFLDRVGGLVDKWLDLQMLRVHAERLADIALTTPEPRGPAAGALPPRERRPVSVELRNVRFRYSMNDPWVLDGVDLRIEAGESVAIVGGSGCGKTTLLKILASLLTPTEGEILIDDKPLSHIGVEGYRAMLGVVMQDDSVFAGSIADNICFFSDHPDPERIEACAKMAAVHDDIAAMPMGYSTLMGDMGTVLSGGQKQRVLIARALYMQPSILLLDEATSHLDVNREKAVNAAIQQSHITRIIVAHRPETIRSADRVIHLELGKVVPTVDAPAAAAPVAPADASASASDRDGEAGRLVLEMMAVREAFERAFARGATAGVEVRTAEDPTLPTNTRFEPPTRADAPGAEDPTLPKITHLEPPSRRASPEPAPKVRIAEDPTIPMAAPLVPPERRAAPARPEVRTERAGRRPPPLPKRAVPPAAKTAARGNAGSKPPKPVAPPPIDAAPKKGAPTPAKGKSSEPTRAA